MPRSREGWLSTIRAISEMTEAHGCTKAEAVTARVKAFELMYKKGISMRDLMAPVSIGVPPAEPFDPGRRTAYEYWEKHSLRSDPFMSQVFSNERGINPHQGIAGIVAVCGIAGLAVWTIVAVLVPESRPYGNAAGSAYNQAEVDKPAEAHSSLRAVRPLKPEQILYSDPSTR